VNKTAEATTDLATLDEQIGAAIALTETATGRIGHVRAFANAARLVQKAVKDNWEDFEYLQGSPLGWKTDDKEYPPAVLQAAITDAIIRGAMPFNGEITVIGGNMYLSLPHFERVARDRPDITDLRIEFDVPEIAGQRAIVGGVLSYRHKGEPSELRFKKTADADTRIPVRVNNGQGDDAIFGKAKRKALAKFLDRLDGSGKWEGKVADDDRTVEGTVAPQFAAPKEPPSKAALKKSCADFTEQIKAAQTTAQVKAVDQAITSHEHYEHAPPGWKSVLEQWITHRLEEVADKTTVTTAEPSKPATAETLDQVFDRFIERLAQTKSVAEAGKVYDAFFAPDSARKWTPEHEAAGAKARTEHNELVRPK